ncbi:MAG: excinuclease ABC subunit UvrC [bacterium]
MIKEKLSFLPNNPGCYMMKDKNNDIIYVGKAKNLKNRVKSYFTGAHNTKTTVLVSEIVDFEYIITSSEVEALILEINLIKKHVPKFNIKLVDDKTYPYILLTNEFHPRLLVIRKTSNKLKGKFFGPYPNVSDAKAITKLLNSIYPFKKCNVLPKKECLYYHMKQCLGPCIKKIDYDYSTDISKVTKFLKGDTKEIISLLDERMMVASSNLDFESAIMYRNLKDSCVKITERQKIVLNDLASRDIVGIYNNEDDLSIEILYMRNGAIVQNYRTIIPYIEKEDTIVNFIAQYYEDVNIRPKELIIENNEIANELNKYLGINCIVPVQGKKKELLDLTIANAKNNLLNAKAIYENKVLKKQDNIYKLGELLNIPAPTVIETFDNSNIFGEYPVSAMVVFKNGVKSPKDYRKYKVKTVVGANDYGTMKEIVYRRYFRLLMEKAQMPNLIIMDGGEIQVNACLEVLSSLNLNIPVLGLKKDNTHTTNVLVFNGNEIKLSKNDDLYLFLANIQQTVHDFAISFFRQSKTKGMFLSKLDNISGLGPVKKEKLLKECVTIDKIKSLSIEEFSKFGINKELAEKILNKLNK